MTDATALASAIADGRTSACDVMEASLAACDARAALGALVYIDKDMARARAKAADALPEGLRGPFNGVPFLAKDLGAGSRGLPASAGAAAVRRVAPISREDDQLFAAFRRSGLIAFGVTATPPFGLALDCEPEGLPPARNPWNPALSPGGSSGGAASAVAGGLVAIAHATDAAGSIRVPAACCGLVGLKPTRGSVPGGPNFSNHLMGIASELVLARSVRDMQTAFAAVGKRQSPMAANDGPRVALALPERCDADQNAAARAAADALMDSGCEVHEVPSPDRLGAAAHSLARAVLAASLAEWLTALAIGDEDVPALASALAAEGRAMPATSLFATSREIERLGDMAMGLFSGADAVLCPVVSSPPSALGAFDLSLSDVEAHFAQMEAFAPNAALANVAGMPALALPFGLINGLPVGVQLLGPPGADAFLCHLAALIEERAPTFSFPYPIAGMPT